MSSKIASAGRSGVTLPRDAESENPFDDYIWTGGNYHGPADGGAGDAAADGGAGYIGSPGASSDWDVREDPRQLPPHPAEDRLDDSHFQPSKVDHNAGTLGALEGAALSLLRAAHTGAVVSPLADELAMRVLALLEEAKREGSLSDGGT